MQVTRLKGDRETEALVRTLEGHAEAVRGVAMDAGSIVSASCDKTLKI